jgi:hypothetical protein
VLLMRTLSSCQELTDTSVKIIDIR